VVLMVVRPLGVVEPLPLTVVRSGQTPVRQGEPCADLWVVESGVFRATIVDAEGRSFVVDLVGPGEAVGCPEGLASPWTGVALRPARLRAVRGAEAAAVLAARAARTATIAADLAWFDVTERVERRLLDLAKRFGRPVPGGQSLHVRLTQDDIAAMVGASRESANRAIRRLIARGALEVQSRGRYVVRTQLRLMPDAS
jgi:CRP/FNR family cyclic AMP-dependent transcriptional regulator